MDMSTYSIPISTKKDAREVGDITNRLQKVLSDVELLFEEEEDDYASIAAERRQFQSRYGNLSAEVDAREKERSEMLKSLAEMLDTDSSKKDDALNLKMEGEETTAQTDDLSEHIETTKMGFEKLQKLKEEMHALASRGKPTQHLQEEKTNLRLKVVEKFKLLYSAKKQNQNKSLGSHWKHAAEEIVDVLHRIRAEGQDSIEDLEKTLLKAEKAVKRQAENMVKLEHKVLEKQKSVDALNKTLAVTTNENELLRSEVERYQDQVITMKKEIRKLEAEAIPKEEPELMDNHTQTFLSMVTLISTINEELSAPAASTRDDRQYIKSVASVVDAATEKHELELKVENLEKKIIEKETQIMMMEHKLSEQGGSVDHKPEPVTLADIPPQPGIGSPPLEDFTSSQEVSPEVRGQSSQTFQVNFNDDAKQKIKELTEDKELLLVEMDKLREQFAQATREIVTLKYADKEQPYVIGMKDNGMRSEHGPQSRTSMPGHGTSPSDVSGSGPVKESHFQDDGSKVADEPQGQSQHVTSEPTSFSRPPLHQEKTTVHTTVGDSQYSSQPAFPSHYQRKSYAPPPQQLEMTQEDDPGLRQSFVPLESNRMKGAQAVAQSNKTVTDEAKPHMGTVLPPVQRNEFSNYMAFPTKGFLPPQAPKMFQYQERSSVGVDDSTQNESTSGSEVELESFVSEIQNYSQYLKDLMQGEITRLTQANEELRRRLSERSLLQFDQLYAHLVNPPPLKEEPQHTTPLPQGQVRRGRFELLKEGRPSPFVSRNAFATLQSGGRVLHQSSSASEQRMKPFMPFQDVREEATRFAPGEQIDAFGKQPFKGIQPRYQSVGATFAAESLPTPSSQKKTTFGKDSSSVDKSQRGPLQSALKDDVGQSQDTPSPQHEHQQSFVGKGLQKYRQQQQKQSLPHSLGDLYDSQAASITPVSGRTAGGAYGGGLPEWERRRSQFSAGLEAIEGLTGTSIQFKQAMASQFAKHFCLSEIKRAKEEEVEMAKREIPRKDDGSRGIAQTAALMHPYRHDELPAGLTASRDLFAERMTSLLESTNIIDSTDYYRAGQDVPGRQLLRPMQTRSLSSIESSHRYLPSLLVHPNQERTNRLLMMLPKAKYPGRGYVVLQTDRFSIYDGRILRSNAEDKPVSHRPVPKNYEKLRRRHWELLERQRKRAQGECKDQQTLRNMINFEEGMEFDHSLEERDENSSKDGENFQNFKRRDMIRYAQEQLFNPDLLRNKYQGLIVNEKA